jgi:hypothetical protein
MMIGWVFYTFKGYGSSVVAIRLFLVVQTTTVFVALGG